LGAAYARALAGRGLNLVLVARRRLPLDALADDIRTAFGVGVLCCEGDLGDAALFDRLGAACSDLEVGVAIYNAAHAPVGEFVQVGEDDLTRVVDVNVRGPVGLLRLFLPPMTERGRGAVVLMTSLAGNQGSPKIAAYAASKAFNRVLAEGLWHELRPRGVDILACCAGAVRTPGYALAAGRDAPGTLDPEQVAERVLNALGRKGPVFIPGALNQLANAIMCRLLPKRVAIGIMAGSTAELAPAKEGKSGT
jgi:short-subunit dehydrogenase